MGVVKREGNIYQTNNSRDWDILNYDYTNRVFLPWKKNIFDILKKIATEKFPINPSKPKSGNKHE